MRSTSVIIKFSKYCLRLKWYGYGPLLVIPSVDLDSVNKTYKEKLPKLLKALMESYDKNSNIKVNARKGGYAIKIKEIIPKLSYDIIQKIDVIMVEIFGLNGDEANFIETFDLSFRMGKEGKDTEESTTTSG